MFLLCFWFRRFWLSSHCSPAGCRRGAPAALIPSRPCAKAKTTMNMLGEIRYAARILGKHPAFTAIAALTLALGIGANTAIFSVVNALLLRPLPYPHSENLVLLRERSETFDSGSVSYPNYLDWRAGQRAFTDLALVRRGGANLSGTSLDSSPERIGCARVSYNFLSILGLPPKLGRDFRESDDLPNAKKVALITEDLWNRRFGRSP